MFVVVVATLYHVVCYLVKLIVHLQCFVFHIPTTEKKWLEQVNQFETQWQLNNCVVAMDGKHVLINKPPGSGSLYYNYKSTFSVVL